MLDLTFGFGTKVVVVLDEVLVRLGQSSYNVE